MSNNLILKYPLDLRGTSATNLVVNEVHDVPSSGNRVIVTNYGPFYTQGLQVVDYSTGEALERGVQWKAAQLYTEAVQRTGKEVCAVIVITDDTVSGKIAVTYQVVGGKFSRAVPVIKDLIDDLDIDEREVQWGDLLAVPEAFPPVSHLHDAGDLYGFEYIIAALEELRKAIIIGDEPVHQEILGYIAAREQESIARDDAITAQFYEHAGDKNNPHSVTKAQVGLGSVQNYGVANEEQAVAGTASNLYMTPQRTRQAIETQVGTGLTSHVDNRDNPHEVTKAQVGLGNVPNYSVASEAEAKEGTRNDRFVTPLRLKQAVDEQVRADFDDHATSKSNPHEVTKAQVGLSNVPNYSVATETEAVEGTRSDRFITPLRLKQAVDAQVTPVIDDHVGNKNNPHGVTKAQVGLGSVQNYATATTTAQATGTATNLYMTPSATREAIDQRVGNSLTTHTASRSNPHGVTKAQVGLGSVQNYGVASATEARDGTLNDRYMTPLRTAQAIQELAGAGSLITNVQERSQNLVLDGLDVQFIARRFDMGSLRFVTMKFVGNVRGGTNGFLSGFNSYIPSTDVQFTGTINWEVSGRGVLAIWLRRVTGGAQVYLKPVGEGSGAYRGIISFFDAISNFGT